MMQHLTRGASGSDGLPNQRIGIALTACGMRADLRSHSRLRSFSGMFGNRGEGLALLRGEELVGLIGHVKRSVRLHCSVLHVANWRKHSASRGLFLEYAKCRHHAFTSRPARHATLANYFDKRIILGLII